MKLLVGADDNITANSITAVNVYGNGTNLTGVGANLPFYLWCGYINLQTLTLNKVYGDDYFGTLTIVDTTGSSTGYRITSDQGAIFTSNKTFVPNFSYFDKEGRFPSQYVNALCTFPSTSIVQVNVLGLPNQLWSSYYSGDNFQDAAIEIKVFK